MQEETKPSVSRRGLLRRASTVAAGVGVAGVATAAIGTPALAADGGNVVIGQSNQGASKTSLTGGSDTQPALRLENNEANRPSLELEPIKWSEGIDGAVYPAGTTFIDDFGNVHVIGQVDAGPKFEAMSYSPSWATMVIPVAPFRAVSTFGTQRDGSYVGTNGFGRWIIQDGDDRFNGPVIKPRNSGDPAIADLTLDFSVLGLSVPTDGFIAVQANITAVAHAGDGWAAVYSGPYAGTSSLNFSKNAYATANFTQTMLAADLTMSVKISLGCGLMVDVVGFVVSDPYAYGLGIAGSSRNTWPRSASAQGARGAKPGPKGASVPRV